MDDILQLEQPTGEPPEHLENDLNFIKIEEIENEALIAAEPNFFPKKEVKAVSIDFFKMRIFIIVVFLNFSSYFCTQKRNLYVTPS